MTVHVPVKPASLIAAPRSGEHLPHIGTAWGARAYALAVNQLGPLSVTDVSGRITYVNDEFVTISGYSREELLGQSHNIIGSGEHPPSFFAQMYEAIMGGIMWRSIICNKAKKGNTYWVDVLIVPLKDERGEVNGFLSLQINITDNVKIHLDQQCRKGLLEGAVESFPGGIEIYDSELRRVVWNRKLEEFAAGSEEVEPRGTSTLEQIARRNATIGGYGKGPLDTFVAEALECARNSEPHCFEGRRGDGVDIEVRGMPLRGGGFVSTFVDISERKRNEEKVSQLARHDSLTGLPNRIMFQERMRQSMARVKRGEKFALLCIDLDRFKPVNDTLGHPVGDELLKAVAQRLTNCVRETDTVARLGGDEFAIIITSPKSPRDVQVAAARIVASMRMPFTVAENTIEIGSSVGIAVAPEDGEDANQLMQHADLALYRAKSAGRGRFEFFEKAIQRQIVERTAVVAGLQRALEQNELEVHYQPVIDLKTRRIAGCEALMRWRDPGRGLIPAAEFIPIAEESGLIGRMGEWLLKTACREAAAWPHHLWLSVNISAAQLRDQKLIDKIQRSIAALDPSRLTLEITETLLIQDNKSAAAIMKRLKELGVRLALDDFGTGFSSLSYLQVYPLDLIKIDRSFVSGVADSGRAAALRRAMIQLANELGMTTTAEGVETIEQFEQVTGEGCHTAQGYLFSKPVPGSELSALFDRTYEF